MSKKVGSRAPCDVDHGGGLPGGEIGSYNLFMVGFLNFRKGGLGGMARAVVGCWKGR